MILSSLTIVGDDSLEKTAIRIDGEKITAVAPGLPVVDSVTAQEAPCLDLDGCIAFPGLINSHEHLDFNNFPLLGNRTYANYTEWGADIHHHNKDTIQAVLKIPRDLRIEWGMYKNLLNGITTVVNHGEELPITANFIDVYQSAQSLHSLEGERRWKYKLNFMGLPSPIAIHIGEGTDDITNTEVDRLIKWNLFRRKIVGIHGVAMQEEQAPAFAALIWCPDSNYFLLGKTAAVQKLKERTTILFGTDSTLTAHWSIWEHLRLARMQKMVTDRSLYQMLNQTAAAIWDLKDRGSIANGQRADIVVARPPVRQGGWDAFYALNPEDLMLVLHKGTIRLFDQCLRDPLISAGFSIEGFSAVQLNGQEENVKYVQGPLPELRQKILSYYPAADLPVT